MRLVLGVVADCSSHENVEGNVYLFMMDDIGIGYMVSIGEKITGFKDIEFQLAQFGIQELAEAVFGNWLGTTAIT